jgi:hypothetical protein
MELSYNSYDRKYKSIDEETFIAAKILLDEDPSFMLYKEQNLMDLLLELLNEFLKVNSIIYIILALGLPVIFCFVWPIVGILGLLAGLFSVIYSIVNFIEDFYFHNNFIKKLNKHLPYFENYEQYRHFIKYEAL